MRGTGAGRLEHSIREESLEEPREHPIREESLEGPGNIQSGRNRWRSPNHIQPGVSEGFLGRQLPSEGVVELVFFWKVVVSSLSKQTA